MHQWYSDVAGKLRQITGSDAVHRISLCGPRFSSVHVIESGSVDYEVRPMTPESLADPVWLGNVQGTLIERNNGMSLQRLYETTAQLSRGTCDHYLHAL